MNYQKIYDDLIDSRRIRECQSDTYYEKHHIVMKSMGGTNDSSNIVSLTAREHFLAHWLLWRIHRNRSASFAFFSMCQFRIDSRKLNFSSRAYEEARLSRSFTSISEETRNKMSIAKLGKIYSAEARKNMSKGKIGKPARNKGIIGVSNVTRERMSFKAQNKKRKHLEFFKEIFEKQSEILSPLHFEILKMYVEKYTNKEIVEKLSIKDYDIKNVLRTIKNKVDKA